MGPESKGDRGAWPIWNRSKSSLSWRRRLEFLLAAFRGIRLYTWRSLKNVAKMLLGRPTYYHDDDLFWRQYLFHVLGIAKIRKITCRGFNLEGGGAQALTVMRAITFARLSGITYVHTAFSDINHSVMAKEEWAAAWERLFNLGAGEIPWDGNRTDSVSFTANSRELEMCFGWSGHLERLQTGFWEDVPAFRRKFHANKPIRPASPFTVSVHIRRGDVAEDSNAHLFTNSDAISRTLDLLLAILARYGITHRVHLYSQGAPSDFVEFRKYGTVLFLDADAQWSLQSMVYSDILVMAKGTFSYCAGLLSEGIKMSERESALPPMDDWIIRESNGDFDVELLRLALERFTSERNV